MEEESTDAYAKSKQTTIQTNAYVCLIIYL